MCRMEVNVKYPLIPLLLVGLIGLAGCVPLAVTPGSIAPTVTPGSIEPTAGAVTPQAGPEAACPGPTEELQRLVNAGHGYCLAYPAEYKVEKPDPSTTMLVIGGGLNAVDPRAHITVTDAQGKTLEEAAQRMEAEYNVGFDPKRSQATVAGEPAARASMPSALSFSVKSAG